MDKNLIDYLPGILREFKEFQVISETENPEVDALWAVIENIMNDQFVDDSTENGVKRWESMLTIVPKGTDTLDVRKFRILTRLNEKLPYTTTKLDQQMRTLCGEGGYSITLQNLSYTLIVKIALIAKGEFDEVGSLLNRTVPANLVVDLTLLYNQQTTLENFTHDQLSAYTQNQLRNEVLS